MAWDRADDLRPREDHTILLGREGMLWCDSSKVLPREATRTLAREQTLTEPDCGIVRPLNGKELYQVSSNQAQTSVSR